jgi:hypothetical protein
MEAWTLEPKSRSGTCEFEMSLRRPLLPPRTTELWALYDLRAARIVLADSLLPRHCTTTEDNPFSQTRHLFVTAVQRYHFACSKARWVQHGGLASLGASTLHRGDSANLCKSASRMPRCVACATCDQVKSDEWMHGRMAAKRVFTRSCTGERDSQRLVLIYVVKQCPAVVKVSPRLDLLAPLLPYLAVAANPYSRCFSGIETQNRQQRY